MKINTIGNTIAGVAIVLLLQSCAATIHPKNKITGIRMTSTFPKMSMEGKLLFYDTMVANIYYYKNQSLYSLEYSLYTPDQDIWIEKPERIVPYYFGFTNGKEKGLLFDTSARFPVVLTPVDSFLKQQWVQRMDIYTNMQKAELATLSEKKDSNAGIYTRTFSFKMLADSNWKGIITHYYSKNYNDIPYSFCRQCDSTMNMKLYRAEIINFGRYLVNEKMNIDRIDQLFLIEKLSDIKEKELLPFFEADKKMNDSLQSINRLY